LRCQHESELRAEIEAWSAQRTVVEVNRVLGEAGIPVAPIRNVQQALESDQAAFRGLLSEVPGNAGRAGRTLRLPSQPVKFSAYAANRVSAAPRLGEHTDEILGAYGFDNMRIGELRTQGVFGREAANSASFDHSIVLKKEPDHA
jgi:CoA:oxalate CoA-transferase